MTVSSTVVRNSYAGDNSTTQFTYTFPIHSSSELKVILRSSAGVETVQTLNSDYTINDTGTGGTVTFTSAPASGVSIVLIRDTNQTQEVDYLANDPFPADTHEGALDKLTLLTQELQEEIDRSLKVSRTAPINNSQITDDATARAGKLLGFSADGNSLDATIDGSGVAVSATNAANSATAAAASATQADTAKVAAQTAQAAAEAALDTFDDDFLGAKASDPSVDNDGNSLTDGSLYFDTTNNVMKVYDLGNTQWKQLIPTASQQTNIDAAVNNLTNINNVAGQISPTNNIGTLAGLNTEISGLYGIRNDITSLGSITAAISAVNSNETNINAVNNNSANINTLAGITNLGNLASAHADVTAVANNLTSVNSFGNTYKISANAPTGVPEGTLWFDTTNDIMKVYDGSSFANAGSSVNGTSQRNKFTATTGQTVFSGNDDNAVALAYDPNFLDTYLNGVRIINGSDYTATDGSTITLTSPASAGDILSVVSFGTFQIASFSATAITSDTVAIARGGTGLSSLGSAGQALVVNSAGNALEYANASSAEVYGFENYYDPSTLNIAVTVQNVGGANKYFIDGVQQDTLNLLEGNTYIFSYPSAHPFALSTTANGTHGGGSEYTTGVTRDTGANTLTYVVPSNAPQLYYYCTLHSGMGGTANTSVPANNTVRYITTNQGQDNITASQYANFDDVLFSASGFTFSLSNGDLIATI